MTNLKVVKSRLFCSGIHHLCRKFSATSIETNKVYTPRRAVLYVPGNDERKLNKIPSLDVDCVVLDCEDGVALNRKDAARQTIVSTLNHLDFGKTECVVRVNSVSSGLLQADLNTILKADRYPQTLMLPKVDTEQHIETFTQCLKTSLNGRQLQNKLKLITFVESAIGLLDLQEIFKRTINLSQTEDLFSLEGVVFGSDDYCADIGATRTPDAKELLYARQRVVTCAKAYRLQAIDLVHIDYKDMEGLKQQSLEGSRMGFTGKQVIHPGQIQVVQESFSPSLEKVEWATELIEAFNAHQATGKGAFTFHGNMIDMPLVLQAENILQMSKAITL